MVIIIVLGLFIIGSFGMLFFGKNENTATENVMKNNNQQSGSIDQIGWSENDKMNYEMHGVIPAKAGGMSSVIADNANVGIDKIYFSNAVGQQAPDFTLTKQDGSKFKLSDYKNKTVILFFNEGAMCYPACWDQIASFGSDQRFNNEDVIAVSVVIDYKEKWDQIIRAQPKYGAGTILFDANTAVSRSYDVLNVPSSMHKGTNPGHTYFIIKNGIISYVMDDPNMALNNDKLALEI